MALKDTLLRIFTWWNGQTMSLAVMTARHGQLVGKDDFGNTYYKAIGPLIDRSVGTERRWVVYNGYADASKVPPGWRGWLCHNGDVPRVRRATPRASGRSRMWRISPEPARRTVRRDPNSIRATTS